MQQNSEEVFYQTVDDGYQVITGRHWITSGSARWKIMSSGGAKAFIVIPLQGSHPIHFNFTVFSSYRLWQAFPNNA